MGERSPAFRDDMTEALAHVHKDEVVDLTRRLIRIPSVNPPGDERPVAELLAALLESEGVSSRLEWVTPERPNLIAQIGDGRGPHLVFNGHMDVVGPGNLGNWSVDPFGAEVINGRIIGRGAVDMKGGLAALASAFLAIHRAGITPRGTLTYAAVMGEETGSEGTEFLLQRGFRADAAIVGECTTALQIGFGYRGAAWFEITARGRTSHGSRPHLGNNAILQMTDHIIPAIRGIVASLPHKEHPDFLIQHPTLNVGTISGGFKVNVVPDACTASFDVRLVPGQSPDGFVEIVRGVLAGLTEQVPGLLCDLTVLKLVEPFLTDRSSALVRHLAAAIVDVTGTAPQYVGKTGYSDANVFAHRLSIPAVAYGPGAIGSGHSPDEWVDIEDLFRVTQTYVAVALRFLREGP